MRLVFAPVLEGLGMLCDVLGMLICFNTLLSWISPDGRLREFLSPVCEFFVSPIRGLFEKHAGSFMQVDFSPAITAAIMFAAATFFSALAVSL